MSKAKILLADDTASIRRAVRVILERSGFEVVEAKDGDDTLAKTMLHRPDLIILDIMMPGRSGLEVAATLKSRAEYKAIPILLLTGVPTSAGKGEEHWKGQSFADDFLAKPCKARQLLEKVVRLLGGLGAQGPGPALNPGPGTTGSSSSGVTPSSRPSRRSGSLPPGSRLP